MCKSIADVEGWEALKAETEVRHRRADVDLKLIIVDVIQLLQQLSEQ